MTKTKSLSQRNEGELIEVFLQFDIQPPDPTETTVKELRSILEEHGITNKVLRDWENKQENKLDIKEYDGREPSAQPDGDVVVVMQRNNPIFVWGKYKFSREAKYIPMPKDEAMELIQKYDGFRIATREEIKRHYQ